MGCLLGDSSNLTLGRFGAAISGKDNCELANYSSNRKSWLGAALGLFHFLFG